MAVESWDIYRDENQIRPLCNEFIHCFIAIFDDFRIPAALTENHLQTAFCD